ncbi:MAG: 50S ribosomal protein L13 [Candidatus Curtissbacteria bacterium]|nr:50S ribosomal protein L13 [bacterium]MDZ4209831.1 50S ribosomal protein L13 [Candidatus Curtissbacteria bacterium]
MTTYSTTPKDIIRNWQFFDAKGQILGRLSTRIAQALMGKNKPYFVRHLDCGDFVVVINAKDIKVTGKKEKEKIYYHHSGYSGGLTATPLETIRAKNPARIIEHAVSGMLPDNKLKKGMMVRLKAFAGEEHPYGNKINAKN